MTEKPHRCVPGETQLFTLFRKLPSSCKPAVANGSQPHLEGRKHDHANRGDERKVQVGVGAAGNQLLQGQ
jgi:hypothetical protein